MKALLTLAAAALGSLALAGCVESKPHLSSDFGRAVREDSVAQVADPDARYLGVPAPGSNGSRVGLAQQRYVTGKVIQPVPASTTLLQATVGSSESK